MSDKNFSLYVLSFSVDLTTGLALVSAENETKAFSVLRNSGLYNASQNKYILNETQYIGTSHSICYGLLYETYTNAEVVYEAFKNLALQTYISGSEKEPAYEEVTWSTLKSYKDSEQLIPGKLYIITDYVATTSSAFSRSANHPFDIAVTAVSKNELSERAAARKHAGDTYFAECNLSAWEISYCVDNDKSRFAWADTENGKGVIYRLKDDCDNDLPYDFKGIQFKRYRAELGAEYKQYSTTIDGLYFGTDSGNASKYVYIPNKNDFKWYYTFSCEDNGVITDSSLFSTTKPYSRNNIFSGCGNDRTLNNNVFIGGSDPYNFCRRLSSDSLIENAAACARNNFSGKTYNNTIYGGECCYVDCDLNIRDNVIIGVLRHCRLGSNFRQNLIFSPKDVSAIYTTRSFEQCLMIAGGAIASVRSDAISRDNILKSARDIGVLEVNESFISNVIDVTNMTYNTLNNFENNLVSYQNSFVNNTIARRMKNCTITKQFANNSFDGAQFYYNTFNARIVSCHFSSIIDYVVIPDGEGTVGYVNFEGGLRGSASSPLSLDYAGMYLQSMSSVSRRMTVEGTADGGVVASWKERRELKGAIKESGTSAWTEFTY